jgi:hypothetical protein
MTMLGAFVRPAIVRRTWRSKPNCGLWGKVGLWPAKRLTTFQRCLALHIAGAERAGALQSR